MGEVYRAHDTTPNRDVALKVLPDAFATDPERLARFEREAKVLASLNHPNIAAIYGLEKFDDTRALILELVEGPTLQDRIAKGPTPLDETLLIARTPTPRFSRRTAQCKKSSSAAPCRASCECDRMSPSRRVLRTAHRVLLDQVRSVQLWT